MNTDKDTRSQVYLNDHLRPSIGRIVQDSHDTGRPMIEAWATLVISRSIGF